MDPWLLFYPLKGPRVQSGNGKGLTTKVTYTLARSYVGFAYICVDRRCPFCPLDGPGENQQGNNLTYIESYIQCAEAGTATSRNKR